MFSIRELLTAALLLVAPLVSSASAQYIYVANAGDDTISKIDITTNQVVATYSTWITTGPNHIVHPATGTFGDRAHQGPAPSRIALERRDGTGYVLVLNRFFSTANTWTGSTNPPHFPVLLKIAPTGGIPGVTTSNGPIALPISDVNNNNDIDIPNTPIEAQDVRILWAKPIGSGADVTGLGRALAIDTAGFPWVGMYSTRVYYKVDPNTGGVIGSGVSTGAHAPYSGQVDKNGKLWSVDEEGTLAEIDTLTGQLVAVRDHWNNGNGRGKNYSLAVFNGCGSTPVKVYLSERWNGRTYIVYDPQTQTFANSPLSIPQFVSVAIGVDRQGNIISGALSGGRIIKTTPGGTVLWDNGPTVPVAQQMTDLHGIIIDANDDVWAVDRYGNRVLKYNGANGAYLGAVAVGDQPYTYGNTPPPTCPCVEIGEHPITCQGQVNGIATYAWSFLFTNHSPFAAPATGIDITSTQATTVSPAHVQFTNPVPPNGQATVSGTFTVSNPVPGSQVCLDVQLNGGEGGWCCSRERVCFRLPECPQCAILQAEFKCQHGHWLLQLSVTNQQSTAAQSVTVFSNTAGVTVSPQTITQTFLPNTPVTIPLTITGASLGQTISLGVSLAGPVDPKTGVNTWCCTSTVTVIYPKKDCPITIGGSVFNDNGGGDYDENGLSGWTVTLADEKGARRTAISDAGGRYSFEDIEQGTYRLSVQAGAGWRATKPATGFYMVTAPGAPVQKFDFGFVRMRP